MVLLKSAWVMVLPERRDELIILSLEVGDSRFFEVTVDLRLFFFFFYGGGDREKFEIPDPIIVLAN